MNTQHFDTEPNTDEDVLTDPEFRRILGDLLEATERGEDHALDRFARQYPHYAPALLEVALYALPVEASMQKEVTYEENPAVAAGVQAAYRELGILIPQNLLDARQAVGWSLGELARRLLLPASLALKLERGQIVTWPGKLAERLAAALEMTREQAQAILQTTAGNFRVEAAAFSAEGDPDIATVAQRRQETFDFEDLLEKERLTPEQATFWRMGR